jgi:hypothetical protein
MWSFYIHMRIGHAKMLMFLRKNTSGKNGNHLYRYGYRSYRSV